MKKYLLPLFLICFSFQSFGQLVIDNSLSNQELAQSLVGSGVEISNVQVICNQNSYARFEEGTSNIGLPEGLLLTTGIATEVANAANFLMSQTMGTPGDATLTSIASGQTYDACIFQFDVRPLGDTLRFRYRFGSEEYPDYVCSEYNDVFAFLISGPNPQGGNYNQQNIAVIPGTNLPVAINTINSGTPGSAAGLFNNCSGSNESLAYSNLFVVNTNAASPTSGSIAFNGITTILTAEIPVVACELYTLRLGIADVGDGILDSGVFIEELTSPEVTFDIATEAGIPYAIPGCNDGILTFHTNFTPSSPLQIDYIVTGSAVPNINYVPFPTSVTIPAGDSSASVIIPVLKDSLGLGGDSIVISLISPCTNEPYDSLVLYILDEIQLEIPFEDTTICQGESVQLGASGAVLYNWSPGATLSDPLSNSPVATPNDTTIYQVIGRIGLCPPDTAHITVNTVPLPFVYAGPDITMCFNDTIELNQGLSDAADINWSPANYLSEDSIINPLAFPDFTTQFILTGANGGCVNFDTMIITVDTELNLTVINDTTICQGQTIQLVTSGAANYFWTPTAGLNNPNIASPFATPTDTITYYVTGTSNNCPDVTDSITVYVIPSFDLEVSETQNICTGDTIMLFASGGDNYSWTPSGTLSSSSDSAVLAFPLTNTVYTVTVGTADCVLTDTILVNVNELPVVIAIDDITACTNEVVELSVSGANVYAWTPENPLSNPDIQNPTVSLTETTTFYVSGTNTLTECSNVDSLTVFIQGPLADAGEDIGFCTGESGMLNANIPAGLTIAWSPVDNLSDITISNPTVSLQNPSSTNLINEYILTVTDSIGCQDFDTVTVIVYPSAQTDVFVSTPPADAQGNYVIFEGESATLDAGGGTDCVWSPQENLNDPFSCFVVATPDTTTTYTVYNVSGDGCEGMSTVIIMVEYTRGFVVPTAFTPDGDGLNDVLYPIITGAYSLEEFKIFNRWGELVFETDSPQFGWDGTYKNAKQPLSVYIWYAVLRDNNGDANTYTGNVTLIR